MTRFRFASLLALTLAATLWPAPAARGDSITVRSQATVTDGTIYLRDIAELEGDQAQTLGMIVIATLKPQQASRNVSLVTVRSQLANERVNWARLSLRGHTMCRVSRPATATTTDVDAAAAATIDPLKPAADDPDDAAAAANPVADVHVDHDGTIREHVLRFVEQMAGVDRADLQVTFADRDTELLDALVLTDRIELEPMARSLPGRLPLVIRRYRDNTLHAEHRLSVTVQRRYIAVVATRAIRSRQTFSSRDVELREVLVDNDRGSVLTDLSDVLGQVASGFLREGELVLAQHVEAPTLVRRGELVTVRYLTGGLVVRLDGTAMEDGQAGDVIRLRNDTSRGEFRARVVGRRTAQLDAPPAVSTPAAASASDAARKDQP